MYVREHVTIDEKIDGEFTKYFNNTGLVFCEGEIGEKAENFIHFLWKESEFILLHLLKVGYLPGDREIETIDFWVLYLFGKPFSKCNVKSVEWLCK